MYSALIDGFVGGMGKSAIMLKRPVLTHTLGGAAIGGGIGAAIPEDKGDGHRLRNTLIGAVAGGAAGGGSKYLLNYVREAAIDDRRNKSYGKIFSFTKEKRKELHRLHDLKNKREASLFKRDRFLNDKSHKRRDDLARGMGYSGTTEISNKGSRAYNEFLDQVVGKDPASIRLERVRDKLRERRKAHLPEYEAYINGRESVEKRYGSAVGERIRNRYGKILDRHLDKKIHGIF